MAPKMTSPQPPPDASSGDAPAPPSTLSYNRFHILTHGFPRPSSPHRLLSFVFVLGFCGLTFLAFLWVQTRRQLNQAARAGAGLPGQPSSVPGRASPPRMRRPRTAPMLASGAVV